MTMTSSNVEQLVPLTSPQPTLAYRFGQRLGRLFIKAKAKATHKYKDVTDGINRSIEAEEAHRFHELQMLLDNQAAEYEESIIDMRKNWLKKSAIAVFIAFVIGICGSFAYLYW
ncbi:hypothetical protein FXN58_11125 [Aggregatibacter actinomycetemcomitans]|nr:hypothetical protein FXN58_11125 [Aggregatibacter actinomycetemcomitans]